MEKSINIMIYNRQERTSTLVGGQMLDRFRNATVAVFGCVCAQAAIQHLMTRDVGNVVIDNNLCL